MLIIEDGLPFYNFLYAVSELVSEFSSVWMVNLEMIEAEGKPLPEIFCIISLFWDH